jgi:hypothetical protein
MYTATMETKIAEHPLIRTVLIGGAGRHQPFLLIELNDDTLISEIQQNEILTEIWPTVQVANEQCPHNVAIIRKHTFLAHPTKPMPRLGKMSVVRMDSLELYQDVIEKLYA